MEEREVFIQDQEDLLAKLIGRWTLAAMSSIIGLFIFVILSNAELFENHLLMVIGMGALGVVAFSVFRAAQYIHGGKNQLKLLLQWQQCEDLIDMGAYLLSLHDHNKNTGKADVIALTSSKISIMHLLEGLENQGPSLRLATHLLGYAQAAIVIPAYDSTTLDEIMNDRVLARFIEHTKIQGNFHYHMASNMNIGPLKIQRQLGMAPYEEGQAESIGFF